MRLPLLAAATAAALFLLAAPASAQTESEPACNAGDAEACFYTGAEYAQGMGVLEDKQKAVTYFLKACDGGIPDGCSTSGVLIRAGEGNLEKDVIKGVEYQERACAMGHVDGCEWALGNRISATSEAYDLKKAIATARAGCEAGVEKACSWGRNWSWDGSKGKYPDMINMIDAGWFAERDCAKGDIMGCYIAEQAYANPESVAFDAAKGLKYSLINCNDKGNEGSCRNVGGVYLDIGEEKLGTEYMRKACGMGHEEACIVAADWERYLAEVAARDARIAARDKAINDLVSAGRYGDAVATALHQLGSKEHAQKAALAARSAGAMGQIQTADLYALALWFPSGSVRAAADAEMSARGTGLEGTFGTGTNEPGMADARWKDLYGSSAPRYSSSSSAPSAPQSSVLSASDAAAQTREKYRWAHCTMKGSNQSAAVCQ
ncbi:beta-lactamase family protein [Hyphomonas hirschiana VP5]|uniref:Beta-lactamase family protein n=1 Tax=Hyphomonas hirschiana VP5 TaxID=1280951 RepID=A0A059FYQ4_9PROT|nr:MULTISPECIES: tetratricopeptide repeat protein [Hyphomonas]KCZ95751.1 beta-lactamase family protein [Hyphomonas hirschiana VP5]